jgi:hypothetical protein
LYVSVIFEWKDETIRFGGLVNESATEKFSVGQVKEWERYTVLIGRVTGWWGV